jgi:hypothetical protein
LIVGLILVFFASVACAAGYQVIGVNNYSATGVQLILSADGGTTTFAAWAIDDYDFAKEALAIALTAKTANLNVDISGWSGGRFGNIKLVDP